MNNPWQSLEELRTLAAVLPVWRDLVGEEDFAAFRALCLSPCQEAAFEFPCPVNGLCFFRINHERNGLITGHCHSDPSYCEDVQFSETDVTPLELNWTRLSRAICQAFGLVVKFRELNTVHTVQIGTWSADAVPVILTIQYKLTYQHLAVAELVATLGQKFILFGPTSRMMDVPCLQMLNRVQAEFFPLDKTTTLTKNGTLHAVKTPGELFANFTPQPKDAISENAARQLFAMSKQLDCELGKKAQPSLVLRLYCVENWEPDRIAKELKCSRALVYARLKALTKKLGRNLGELREFSAQFQRIEDSLSDHRARHICRNEPAEGD